MLIKQIFFKCLKKCFFFKLIKIKIKKLITKFLKKYKINKKMKK